MAAMQIRVGAFGRVEIAMASSQSTNKADGPAPAHGASRPERCGRQAHDRRPMRWVCRLAGRFGWRQPDYESRRWSLQARCRWGVLDRGLNAAGAPRLPRSVTFMAQIRSGGACQSSCTICVGAHQTGPDDVLPHVQRRAKKNAVLSSQLQSVPLSEFVADYFWL